MELVCEEEQVWGERTLDFGGAFFGLQANLTVFSKLILARGPSDNES